MGTFQDLDIAEIKSAMESLRWPSASTNLRALGENWQHHALVGRQRGPSLGPIHGYRDAAEVLAKRMTEDHYGIDDLAYPFVECWRHHIELLLKDLLNDLLRLNDRPTVTRIHHKINNLWQEVRPLLVTSHPDDGASVHVGRVIQQLAKIDPDGQDFRYYIRRDGTPTLRGVDRLDVRNFHEAMLEVSDYLFAVCDATDALMDMKADMLGDW